MRADRLTAWHDRRNQRNDAIAFVQPTGASIADGVIASVDFH